MIRPATHLPNSRISAGLLTFFRLFDLINGIDLALKLRRIGRERRQERSRKGWRTRRGK